MPRLIFWNVCGRFDTIPKVEGEQGICLLSGFSQNAARVAAHREITDPWESLMKVLDSERYAPVENFVLKSTKIDFHTLSLMWFLCRISDNSFDILFWRKQGDHIKGGKRL